MFNGAINCMAAHQMVVCCRSILLKEGNFMNIMHGLRNDIAVILMAVVCVISLNCFTETVAASVKDDYTIDDLRDIVRYGRIFTDETSKSFLVALYENGASTEEIISAEQKLGVTYQDTKLALRYFVEQVVIASNSFRESMENGDSINIVMEALDNAERMRIKYESEAGEDAYKYDSRGESNIKKINDDINTYCRNRSENNVVGAIGSVLEPFVNGWEIEDIDYEEVHSGLSIKNTGTEQTDVYAQFNGTVLSIGNDGTGRISVYIGCGYGLSYFTDGLEACDVVVGQHVKQYQKIGSLHGLESATLRVELDGGFIDPLLMFGQLAKYELNNWMNRNPIKAQEVGVDNISAFEPGKNSPDKAEINTGDGVAELVEPGDGISYYKEGEDRHNNVGGSVKAVLDNIESGFDVNINGDENVNGVGNIGEEYGSDSSETQDENKE